MCLQSYLCYADYSTVSWRETFADLQRAIFISNIIQLFAVISYSFHINLVIYLHRNQ